MRQTRINTQNMIVLTVEFTRILFPGGGKSSYGTSVSTHITLRRLKLTQSHIKYTTPSRQTLTFCRLGEQ